MILNYEFDDNEFEYEVVEKEAIEFIAKSYAKTIKIRNKEINEEQTKTILQSFIYENNLEEEIMKQWQDELKEHFYDDAQICYCEALDEKAEYECMEYDYLHSRI